MSIGKTSCARTSAILAAPQLQDVNQVSYESIKTMLETSTYTSKSKSTYNTLQSHKSPRNTPSSHPHLPNPYGYQCLLHLKKSETTLPTKHVHKTVITAIALNSLPSRCWDMGGLGWDGGGVRATVGVRVVAGVVAGFGQILHSSHINKSSSAGPADAVRFWLSGWRLSPGGQS